MDKIIKLENLHYTYPDDEIETLKGISLEIDRGSFVAVLGHNGSGKSTLAKLLNALLVPTEGKVYINGMDSSDESLTLEIRRTVGLVFQNPDNQLVANLVEDDVAFAPENLGIPADEIRRRVDEALETVGLSELKLHAPHLLSGGQKQRVAIAGILAMLPDCIVLDEPTAMLDPAGRKEVLSSVHKLCREKGISVILITHHMSECIDADRVIVLSDGHVVADGSPSEVFSQVELLESEGISVPETTKLLFELKNEGFELELSALTTGDCAEQILEVFKAV